MVNTASAKLFADLIGGCKAKVCYGDLAAVVEAQNVFGFQVAMVYSQ